MNKEGLFYLKYRIDAAKNANEMLVIEPGIVAEAVKEIEQLQAQLDTMADTSSHLIEAQAAEIKKLQAQLTALPLNTEPSVFKFRYYPTRGYACSHPGDNTGYYVNLNDYQRLKDQIEKIQTGQGGGFPISAPWGEPLDYDLDIDSGECTCGTGTATIAGEEHAEGCPMRDDLTER